MRILFLGAGSIGGYYGGRLMQAGANVTFLVRPRRQAQLMEQGLRVTSPHGDIRLPAQCVTKARGPYDLVVLTNKAYDLEDAIQAVTPAMGPGSRLLPLLNGLRHLDRLDQAFGADRVMGGLAHISTTLDPDGTIRHLNQLHRITFGARDPGQAAAADALADAFRPTSVEWRQSGDVLQDLWEKFTFLCSLAATTTLVRGSIGTILAQPGGEAFIRAVIAECRSVAQAEGHPPRPPAAEEAVRLLTQPGSPLAASMLRDIQKGGPSEGEHIVGDMLARGERHGLTLPTLAMSALALRVYEAERARG
ncbi:2-dehydropantoate 2-reductase [Aerophototrophica crusticola]|uniref:2-dehydropantoate 2-reductase n=1 Tax=Aerophototrophica crusticola TaxID=1709002 RepID=A0A858R443_9PROT|nr:2-dehydropantoate 2-reductase [Rhodospirillaceae bacterium B3]